MKKANLNNKPIAKIFPDAIKLVDAGKCPFCKKEIVSDEFRDALSIKEYQISGICQSCQDEVFG